MQFVWNIAVKSADKIPALTELEGRKGGGWEGKGEREGGERERN